MTARTHDSQFNRHPAFNAEKAALFLAYLLENLPITQAAAKANMVNAEVYYWQITNPEFADTLDRVQKFRVQLLADETMVIADNDNDASRARNRIQARQWYASRIDRDKFGDSVNVNVNHRLDLRAIMDEAKGRVTLDGEVVKEPQALEQKGDLMALALDIFAARQQYDGENPLPHVGDITADTLVADELEVDASDLNALARQKTVTRRQSTGAAENLDNLRKELAGDG